jgi:response regulator RpfG family c-di-GMP phosphodiesterase
MTSTKSKILIADDEPDLLSLMQDLLSDHFDVIVAKDGHEAKKYIDEEEFLFLILDIHLPKATGLELCQGILESTKSNKPNIVILSGDDTAKTIRAAYDLNIDDYIVKPISPLAFLQRMQRLERDILDLANLEDLRKQTLNMADTAMRQASEYGGALELIARLNCISDPVKLAKEVAEYFKSTGYFSAIQFRSELTTVNFDIDLIECSEVEIKIFNVLHQHGRIYSFGRRIIFNDEHVSILVKNMPPISSHAYGMLVDIAAKIVPAINSRFISLCNEKAINNSVTILSGAMDMVAKGISAMELEKRDIIQGVISQISGSFHQLELSDEQEQYFINLIETQLENKEVSSDFLTVRDTLKNCLESVQSAQKMTLSAHADNNDSVQSPYQDVELF